MSLRLPPFEFTKGLHHLNNGCYAWLQPDGSWGLSNAGLVVEGEESLLVDTLYDHNLTAEMLAGMRAAIPAATNIKTIINTHSNGDHCNGNSLVGGAQIISSDNTKGGMKEESPEMMVEYMKKADGLGAFGTYFKECFGRFDFTNVKQSLPTKTFSGAAEIKIGNRLLNLIEVGPAHTTGDTIIHIPDADVIYAGDILFIEGHPLMWVGPVDNWLKACQTMLDLKPKIVVPGHGPITDARGIKAIMEYFEYVAEESAKHQAKGRSVFEAAAAIAPKYAHWTDSERIIVNVVMQYSEIKKSVRPNMLELFGYMANFKKMLKTPA